MFITILKIISKAIIMIFLATFIMLVLCAIVTYQLVRENEYFTTGNVFGNATDRLSCSKEEKYNQLFFEVDNFLTHNECDELIKLAIKQGLVSSQVNVNEQASHVVDQNVRISHTTWFDHGSQHVMIATVKEKVDALIKTMNGCFPENVNFEPLQIVKYLKGGKYDPHFDGQECIPIECKSKTQRIATFLMYLNDEFTGGHTAFPNLSNVNIKPKKGKLLFFWVADPKTSQLYRETLHGGLILESGEKWIATQWIRV